MTYLSPAISVTKETDIVERPRDVRSRYFSYAFFLLLVIAMSWGLFVRFNGLGSRPLVEDEYFSIRAVQYILEKGVPEFPTGGYYMRGLPLQYLQAGSVLLFGDNEFAHRLPAALFGVLTLAFVFLYARIFLPMPLAATCVAMLAVSGWEIEFGRFSRMYAAFQCITVAFFLAYYHAYFGGKEKLRYLPHVLALLAILCQQLGVFLLPFLFLPLFIKENYADNAAPSRNRWTFATVSVATVLVAIACLRLSSWLSDFQVARKVPDGFHEPSAAALGPLGAYAALPLKGSILGVFLVITLGIGCFLFFSGRSKIASPNFFSALDVGLVLLLLSAGLHLFAVSLCIVAVLLIRYQLHRSLCKDKFRLGVLALSGVIGCAWVFYALSNQSWREQVPATRFLQALRIVFFGWPDFYIPILRPWIDSLPILTVLFLAALIWYVTQQRRQSVASMLGHPIIILFGMCCAIAVVDPIVRPMAKTTRYFYHVYPFVIVIIVMALYEAARKTTARVISPKTQVLLSGFMAMGLFTVSHDFSLHQLLHVNSPEISFRTGKFKRYEQLWFWRRDDRSPAEFLNAHRSEVDAVVLSVHARTLPYYLLHGVSFAYYCSREGTDEDAWRYGDIARSKGKLELWTGRPLLGTEEELRAYTKHIRSLYLVRLVAPDLYDFDVNHVWSGHLVSCKRVFLSSDGSTEVVKSLLNQPDAQKPVGFLGQSRLTSSALRQGRLH